MIETRFKETEVGRIPEDWEVKALGDVLSVGNGRDYKHLSFGDIPVYGTGGFMTSVSDYLHDGETVCIGRKGTIDEPQYHTGKIWTVDTLFYTYGFQNVCVKYLFYLFNRIDWKKYNEATGVPSLTSKNILGIYAQFPDYSEQTHIATALSDIDALISELGNLIEKKLAIKQGAMQQLLTGRKRLKGFTEPWVEKKLGSLCKLFGRIGFRGYTKQDLVEKGKGAITFSPSDIHNQRIDYSNCDYISFAKYEESPEIKVYNGDIIFAKTASIGKCSIIEGLKEKATINPQFVVLKDFSCDNLFLYYKLIDKEFQNNVWSICGGSTIPTMSQEKLKLQILNIPSDYTEQSAIASVLSSMDEEISALEAKREKYIAIKQGMMQQLLTGKIRLID